MGTIPKIANHVEAGRRPEYLTQMGTIAGVEFDAAEERPS